MNKPKDRWTKSELTLKCGPAELAAAVIRQWHADGEPASDKQAIEYWKALLNACGKGR